VCGTALGCLASRPVLVRADEAGRAQTVGFESSVRGLSADAVIGTSGVGDSLLFELGGQWQGIRSFSSGRWLLQWEALLAARGGYLANQHPYLFLLGARLAASAEAGYRFSSAGELSPYAGVRLASEQQLLAHPGRSLSAFEHFNNVDGVGGIVNRASSRIAGGASLLSGDHSLLAVGFVEEGFRDLQVNAEALALTLVGVSVRFDLRERLATSLQAAWGISAERRDARGFGDYTSQVSVAAVVRWVFQNRSWLGAAASLARDSDHLQYDRGRSYDTRSAPVCAAGIVYGFSLERRP
jgi:hypothetical protein